MHWRRFWPEYLLLLLVFVLESPLWTSQKNSTRTEHHISYPKAGWTSERKLSAREQTRALWDHGFNNYMRYAFPLDELSPLSCIGHGPDWDRPDNIALNDVAGNYSLTLIDVLDTFVVLNDKPRFEQAVRDVIDWVSFDVNTKPQVFEITIRVLGGLLSAHQFANDSTNPFYLPWYKGELLDLAYDLGKRLLPAFNTPTGIPYARTNLRKGVSWLETTDTCAAAAGSLILEFATLSRLTGDDRFEKVAHKAFFALWNRKSDVGLVGNQINIYTGVWSRPEMTSVGAGVDSFYEYALKWYVMSGDVEFLDVWLESYSSIMRYVRSGDGFWYRNVNVNTGDVAYASVDSLSAFWPGLQVLAGDVQNAIKSHLMFWNIWRLHSGLPEVWDINHRIATSLEYPLRPEFVESTWYLYRATRDPFYLDVGERILYDITRRCKVECGLASVKDLRTNVKEDRMESFALSETLKYLFLLFDEENPLHYDDSNYVFTTEGHILKLEREHLKPLSAFRRKLRGAENHQCPAYQSTIYAFDNLENQTGLSQGIRSRHDFDYSRELMSLLPQEADEYVWSPHGWCEKPRIELFSYDFLLTPDGSVVTEDTNPGARKMSQVSDGYVLHDIKGIRAHIVSRLDGLGYDIRKLGPHTVRAGQLVYIDDPSLNLVPIEEAFMPEHKRHPEVSISFFSHSTDPSHEAQSLVASMQAYKIIGSTALFGADLSEIPPSSPFNSPSGVILVGDSDNSQGCLPYEHRYNGEAILVHRGNCTFLEKLILAKEAGASGVIVISDGEISINPSVGKDELAKADNVTDVAIVVLTHTEGTFVSQMVDTMNKLESGQVKFVVHADHDDVSEPEDGSEPRTPIDDERSVADRLADRQNTNHILYLNGHPLLNTRLIF